MLLEIYSKVMKKFRVLNLAIGVIFCGSSLCRSLAEELNVYEAFHVCDSLYVLSPAGSTIWDDGVVTSLLDKSHHELEKIISVKTAEGKFKFLRVEQSKRETYRFASTTRAYEGSLFNNGSSSLPIQCSKISVLDARNPDKVTFIESIDPKAISL